MNRVFLMGDVHGRFQPIRDFVTYMNSTLDPMKRLDSSDTLILLGDFGGNFFFNYRDDDFKTKLGKYNLTYFVVRGNHEARPSKRMEESPQDWHYENYFGNSVMVENKYPYIKYAMDEPRQYYIYGHSTLIIPGAYSVDKFFRIKNGWSWFEDEQLTDAEMDLGRELITAYPNWDIVLSHTCPVNYEPTDLFLSSVDQSMVDKTMERYLGEIEYRINYKLWAWGHYHANRIYPKVDDSDRLMLFNTAVLDLDKYFLTDSINDSLINLHGTKVES